jgi:HSP20 family protein
MNLLKKREDVWLPSILDDFFTPNLFRDVFNRSMDSWQVPAVNIKETDRDYQLELAVPGKKKEDFKIEIDGNILTISSEERKEREEREEGRYTRREFSYSSFKRSFTLPAGVIDSENIKATYDKGVLIVSLAKKEVKPHKPVKMIDVA